MLRCSDGSFAPATSQCTELEELEAFLATQELLAFENVDISSAWGMNSIKVHVSKSLPQ